jgi:hypothetical protein
MPAGLLATTAAVVRAVWRQISRAIPELALIALMAAPESG